MATECLFCRIVAGELPSTQLYADDLVVAIRDIAPRAPTHILLLSRVHIQSAADLDDADAALAGRIFAVAGQLARSEGIADEGFRLTTNVGRFGGQSVDSSPRSPDGRAADDVAPGLNRSSRLRGTRAPRRRWRLPWPAAGPPRRGVRTFRRRRRPRRSPP